MQVCLRFQQRTCWHMDSLQVIPLQCAVVYSSLDWPYVSRAVRLRRMEVPRSHYSRKLRRYWVRMKCFLMLLQTCRVRQSHIPAIKADVGLICWPLDKLVVDNGGQQSVPLAKARCCSKKTRTPWTGSASHRVLARHRLTSAKVRCVLGPLGSGVMLRSRPFLIVLLIGFFTAVLGGVFQDELEDRDLVPQGWALCFCRSLLQPGERAVVEYYFTGFLNDVNACGPCPGLEGDSHGG